LDSWTRWTGIILVALALARAAVLVAHDPVAGYANAGEMNGTGACIGLFPATAPDPPPPSTPQAPSAVYRAGKATGGCYWSAETVLDGAVVFVARSFRADPGRLRIQWIGYTKLALLFLTAFAVAAALRRNPAASIAHGAVVLLVLADPVVTLWLNTLYREFLTIWALYAVVAAASVIALADRPIGSWCLLMTGLVVLAFSREHFAVLGIAMVALAWPWLWHRSQRLTAASFAIALAAGIAAFVLLEREGTPRVPAADVATVLRAAMQALAGLQHAAPAGVGALEGTTMVAPPDLPLWAFPAIDALVRAMSPSLFATLQLAMFVMAPLAVVSLLALRRWRGDPLVPLLAAMLLGAIALHAFAVAFLGGGAGDPVPRYLPAILAMCAAFIAAAVGIPALVRRWVLEPRDMPLEALVGCVAIGVGAYGVMAAISS